MNKIILKGHEARKKILEGVTYIDDIVETTYGPFGHNVILSKPQRPKITKDGATVVNEVDSEDPFKKIGIQLTKDVVSKVDATSGDGTTTTTIYFRHLMEGAESLASKGYNCRNVRKGIVLATDTAIDYLKSKAIKTMDIRSIVDISSNGSKEIADLLVEAIETVGDDGVIHLDESTRKDGKSYIKKSNGYSWPAGYPSSLFISDQISKSSVVRNPWVLVSEQPLLETEEWDQLKSIRAQALQSKKNIVIIAPGFDNKFYNEAVESGILFITAPGFGSSPEKRMDHLIDLSKILNTEVLPNWQLLPKYIKGVQDLGSCESINCKKDSTTITLQDELTESHALKLQAHIDNLKKLVDESDELTPTLLEYLNNRIADISGGVCTIYVGALTPTEKEEKYDLFVDSLHSVNNAIKYGVLPGGGTALLKTSNYLSINIPKTLTTEEKAGWDLVTKSLMAPGNALVKTVKPDDYQYITQQVRNLKDFNKGYNLFEDKVMDLVSCGIIDAAKIEMDVLRYSSSVVSSFILSEGVIVQDCKNTEINPIDPYMMEGK